MSAFNARDYFATNTEPCDSYENLKSKGLELSHGSCSQPGSPPGNKGCKYKKICRWRQYRDVLKRPGMVGVIVQIESTGAANGLIMPCHHWYKNGLDHQQANPTQSGKKIRVVALEGGDLRQQTTVGKHRAKPDPNCPTCRAGTCGERELITKTVQVPQFKCLSDFENEGFGAELFKDAPERYPFSGLDVGSVDADQGGIDITLEGPSTAPALKEKHEAAR